MGWLSRIGIAVALIGLAAGSAGAVPKLAGPWTSEAALVRVQMGPGGAINPERDCQTVRQCRFARGGSYRGCISAYSCRSCALVPTRCTVIGGERVCQEMRCSWGGPTS